MKIKLAVAVGLASVIVLASGANATILTNGDFESVINTFPTGWTIGSGTEILDLKGSDYIPCCQAFGTQAELDNHFASFGPGDMTNVSTLSQTFDTTPGDNYSLTFQAGAMGDQNENLVASIFDSQTHSSLATTTIFTIFDNNLDTTFATYFLTFTATGTSSEVAFDAVGDGISVDPILDNVSISAVPATLPHISTRVPEPLTLWLFGSGVAGIVSVRRRMKKPGSL